MERSCPVEPQQQAGVSTRQIGTIAVSSDPSKTAGVKSIAVNSMLVSNIIALAFQGDVTLKVTVRVTPVGKKAFMKVIPVGRVPLHSVWCPPVAHCPLHIPLNPMTADDHHRSSAYKATYPPCPRSLPVPDVPLDTCVPSAPLMLSTAPDTTQRCKRQGTHACLQPLF